VYVSVVIVDDNDVTALYVCCSAFFEMHRTRVFKVNLLLVPCVYVFEHILAKCYGNITHIAAA